jgi:integrase
VKSRRTISPLPEVVINALREHQQRQDSEKQSGGDRWLNTRNLVFATEFGAPLSASVVTHDFGKVLKRAGLPHMRFHDLRHSCASFLLKQGVHPRAVMELLGHSQINLTLNTYSHVLPSVHKETAAAMDRVLTGK